MLFLLCACSNYFSSENNDTESQTGNDEHTSKSETSNDIFYIGNTPESFVYREIEYTFKRQLDVAEVDVSEFKEEELVAVIINPLDEEKFLSENYDCNYIIYDTLYNYYDEDNRLYVYRYEDYDTYEYLVAYTKMFSVLYEGDI